MQPPEERLQPAHAILGARRARFDPSSRRAMRTLQRVSRARVSRESKELRLPACRGGLSSHESPLTTRGSRLYAMRATVCASCATNCCLSTPRLLRVDGYEPHTAKTQPRCAVLVAARHGLGRVRHLPLSRRAALFETGGLRQSHHRGRDCRVRAERPVALRRPTPVDCTACSDHRRRPAGRLHHRARLARRGEPRLRDVHGRRPAHGGNEPPYGLFRRRRQCDVSDGLLDRAVLRLQVLRIDAVAAGSGAARLGAGAGSATQDAALPAESAFPVQHAQCDLDADSRQSQCNGELRGHRIVRVPALHAGPGSR